MSNVLEMVIRCSGNVCYVSLKGHIRIECHSQISGVRVGCQVNGADSYTFRKNVLVADFGRMMMISVLSSFSFSMMVLIH